MRKHAILLAAALALCLTGGAHHKAAAAASAECVVEVSSRRVLHDVNAECPLPIASTTKIVTAAIVLEDCALSQSVTIPAQAAGVEGSSIYLKAGETYTVEELLYGLMLRSGNDAAVALALHHSGSVAAFAREMTRRAAFWGATDSRFANPHGLPDKRHRTTARDLAFIAAHAMENESFRTIVSTRYYAPRGWENKNKMLARYEGASGIKTGFTTEAGRCLVTSAVRDGMTLVSVVLGCPDMYARSTELLDAAFARYRLIPLCSEQERVGGAVMRYSFSYPLTEEEGRLIERTVVWREPRPEKAGEVAGQIIFRLKNRLLFSQNLYMMEQ